MNTKQGIIKREYYSDSITNFLKSATEEILGEEILGEEILGKLALNSDLVPHRLFAGYLLDLFTAEFLMMPR